MAARLFDPHASRAVLIGVSRYSSLSDLRPVRRSVSELASVLTDDRIGRLPARHCTVVRDPADGNAVGRAVGRAAAEATDMLLVYYAGHGLGGLRRSQLFLALKDTDPERPAFHSLAYDVLREEVLDSPAKNRVVILDCCFSGRAAAPVMAGEAAAILEQLDIEGAYVLTASPANRPAISGAEISEFTGELVQALRRGVPGAPQLLTLNVLYAHLRTRLKARNLPEPQRLHTNAAGNLALASNALHNPLLDELHHPPEIAKEPPQDADAHDALPSLLVNLARRSQILVHRLIGHLDRLERGEEDPDRLADLFQLDHLATRMRRNDENLLVLAGADFNRLHHEPAPISDVLRAAQSEIEMYTRIEFGFIDHSVEIVPYAVKDLINLIAELFDNATAFSPPATTATVKARRLRSGVLVEITDRGIGIPPDELAEINGWLAAPTDFRTTRPNLIGMQVVARLAVRHRIKVELRNAGSGGTIADVLLPPAIIAKPRQTVPTQAAKTNPFEPLDKADTVPLPQVFPDRPSTTARGRASVPENRAAPPFPYSPGR